MDVAPRHNLRVGAMVVVALLLAMAGTFLIGREQRFWEQKLPYEIRFARINGLRVGSIVSLTGVNIGSVDDVSFPDNPLAAYISVRIAVSSRAAGRIRGDSLARIRTIGLLGDKYVEISSGSPESPLLPPGSIIPSADPIDYEALLGEGGDVITNIVEVTNSLKGVLASIDRGEGLLGEIVKNRGPDALTLADLHRTVTHVEAATASLERMMKDVERGRGAFGVLLRRGDDVQRLIDNLNRASQRIGTLSERLEAADGALPRLLEDREFGEALLRDLRSTIRNLSEVSEKINHGRGTAGALVNDSSLYEEAKDLVSSTRSSWVYSVYRGVRGLFPPYAPSPALDSPPSGAERGPSVADEAR